VSTKQKNVFNNEAWCWHFQQIYGYWGINQEQGLPIVKNLLIKTSKVISREPRVLEYYWGVLTLLSNLQK
jgi:hypothetical protein